MPLLSTSTCPWAMMKNLLRSSPSTRSLLPSDTSSVLKRLAIRVMLASGSLEKRGTLRSDSDGNEAVSPDASTPMRSALGSSTLVRVTRYTPPCTCTHGSRLKSQRGVIDIILGDVLVVSARFLATDVVTLRCNRPFDMASPQPFSVRLFRSVVSVVREFTRPLTAVQTPHRP